MHNKFFISCLLFILAVILIGQNLHKPFWGEHDWNGARYGNIARNYLREGVLKLKFAQIENSGPIGRKSEYFTHYPPLLPILISFSYMIFGVNEWSTRLIPLLATSGSIVLIFLIGNKLQDLKTGFLASLLALSLPVNLYFGKTPVHEPLVIFFILLAYFAYLYIETSDKLPFRIWFIITMIIAHLTTWAGYFLIPSITAVVLLSKDKAQLKRIIPYWLIPIAMFSAYLVFVYFHTGSLIGGDLMGVFLQRSIILQAVQPTEFNLVNYVGQLRLWIATLYSTILMLLVAAWFIILLKRKLTNSNLKFLILALFGVIYLIVFPNAAFIHNYLVIYLMPFFVLSSARVIWTFTQLKIMRRFALILPLIFLSTIFLERKQFLEALNKSDADRFAVEVGKEINKHSEYNNIVLISPVKFSYSADKFLRFYSDRELIYSDSDNLDYDVKVLVNQADGKFEIIRKE